jgi:ABC-2 type transport system permease protein
MNIFRHEFRARLRSVLTWCGSLIALILVFMAMFQSFSAESAMVNDLMAAFPEELLIAFGMTNMDWSTVLGYFGLVFVFAQICLAVQAANYGFSLVSIEETEWTADFLLSKPVGRTRIMTGKLLAAVCSLLLTDVVVWVSSLAAVALFRGDKPVDMATLALLLISLLPFQAFFLSVGMVISLLVKRIRSVTPFSMGLVFGLYILNAFGGMIGEQSLEVISPFKHFAPGEIIANRAWDLPLVLVSVAAIVVSVVGSYLLYARRDIPAAV